MTLFRQNTVSCLPIEVVFGSLCWSNMCFRFFCLNIKKTKKNLRKQCSSSILILSQFHQLKKKKIFKAIDWRLLGCKEAQRESWLLKCPPTEFDVDLKKSRGGFASPQFLLLLKQYLSNQTRLDEKEEGEVDCSPV